MTSLDLPLTCDFYISLFIEKNNKKKEILIIKRLIYRSGKQFIHNHLLVSIFSNKLIIFTGFFLQGQIKEISFKNLFENICSRTTSKINLIRRIKGLKLKNSLALCKIIFKGFIRSIFDYALIPLCCATQKISSDLQKLQNKIFGHIKFFPIKTKITDMHFKFKLDLIETRSKVLIKKFFIKKSNHQQLRSDLNIKKTISVLLRYIIKSIINNLPNFMLNTNVSKLNSENEAIKKLIIGGETDSSFFTPGTKRKAERTYSSSSDSEAIETITIYKSSQK
ncbi:hypothetical protein BpHYR1_018547 [Brachionus plicatilis]|uniref:RNA-directed DNA polymerase from mobile element jockey-like n=1 Tax=Brachionus plicatilis TaxID=10195 RepID=A0A3M7P8S9_BRAPC|nr:hypothetical protein BpHYR1_018547 [Brachionus plicatilis]